MRKYNAIKNAMNFGKGKKQMSKSKGEMKTTTSEKKLIRKDSNTQIKTKKNLS